MNGTLIIYGTQSLQCVRLGAQGQIVLEPLKSWLAEQSLSSWVIRIGMRGSLGLLSMNVSPADTLTISLHSWITPLTPIFPEDERN